MMRTILSAICTVLFLAPNQSLAQAEAPSVDAMVEQLVPQPRTRSIGRSRGIVVEGRRTENASLNLYVNFEYDSDALKQDALIMLDRLAEAFRDGRLSEYDFLIAGHTDATGSEAYNQQLSERRARSVKNYLIRRHGISNARLIDKGFGEERLLDPDNPADGSNRRVQIITLSIPDQ